MVARNEITKGLFFKFVLRYLKVSTNSPISTIGLI